MSEFGQGAIRLVSSSSSGVQAKAGSIGAVFSPDGSKVAFYSAATNLVPDDTNGSFDVFVKDLVSGVISLVSTSSNGEQGNSGSVDPVFSPDGTKVAFASGAPRRRLRRPCARRC